MTTQVIYSTHSHTHSCTQWEGPTLGFSTSHHMCNVLILTILILYIILYNNIVFCTLPTHTYSVFYSFYLSIFLFYVILLYCILLFSIYRLLWQLNFPSGMNKVLYLSIYLSISILPYIHPCASLRWDTVNANVHDQRPYCPCMKTFCGPGRRTLRE